MTLAGPAPRPDQPTFAYRDPDGWTATAHYTDDQRSDACAYCAAGACVRLVLRRPDWDAAVIVHADPRKDFT